MSAIALSVRRVGAVARASEAARRLLGAGIFRHGAVSRYSTEERPVEPAAEDKKELPQTLEQCHASIESLTAELNSTRAALMEYEDKYKRALADGENVRRRMMKQVEDAKSFAIQSFCKDLLEVADTLAIASESVPQQELTDGTAAFKSLHDGVRLTSAQLSQVFARHGLTRVHPLNEKFDPNLHEALFQQEVQGATPGTVVTVSKVGYKLHERCVRPALVGVAKAP